MTTDSAAERVGCCADEGIPCSYHAGYEDGWHAGRQRMGCTVECIAGEFGALHDPHCICGAYAEHGLGPGGGGCPQRPGHAGRHGEAEDAP